MPELPEVETVRLGLAPVLVGNRFASVEQRREDLRFPLPKHFAERLRGRTVDALDRRAKYLLARLDDGEVLVMHLGMTGRFSIDQANGTSLELGEFADEQKPTPKHEHIVFHLADGTAVRYSDTRRFGLMDLIPGATLPSHALFKGLGIEPLGPDFTPEWLASRLKGKATSIKAALIDQRLIAGIGNIYACEALFRAGISPMRLAGTLATKTGKPTKTIEALVKASRPCSARRSRPAARRCATTSAPTAGSGASSIPSKCMAGRENPVERKAAAAPSAASSRAAARPSTVQTVNDKGTRRTMFANELSREQDIKPANNYETIIVTTEGKVGLITLNRPHALNALNTLLISELNRALDGFEADPEIGCIVITGSEKAFAAGVDIKEMHKKTFVEAYGSDFIAPFDRISHCRKPIIAAVAGYALGGGCELAMSCDIILAADNAVFGQPEINLGIMPGAGGTQRLTRAVGKAKAMELCLTGRRMDAEEAERSGLVSRIVPVAELHDEAMKVADKIANLSQHAVMMIKEAINRGFATTLAEGTRFERGQFYSLFATEDQKEGMAAFIEKRKPVFKNK